MAVLDFYTRVFERGPDTAPMDDFLEWQICPGTWLQLSTGHQRPGANNARVRFEVEDLQEAVQRMASAQVPMGETVTVPGVVAFSNFSDHWGNALGFYQLLAPRDIVAEAERRRQERERQEELEDALAVATSSDDRPDGAAPGTAASQPAALATSGNPAAGSGSGWSNPPVAGGTGGAPPQDAGQSGSLR